MDSHLSNAQRCARKADSLVKYGMYDEALSQLDKSIVYLYELKTFTTRYENIQMLNVQIESIDRKKRSIAIKRSESIKKKNRISNLVNKAKNPTTTTTNNIRIQHIPTSVIAATKKCDQSPVIIEYCFNNSDNITKGSTAQGQHNEYTELEAMFIHGRKKLDKDDKSIIEELATTNAEYKKVNSYLADEIEQLKRENDLLKVELIKIHMSDSLTSNDSATNQIDLSASTPKSSIRSLEGLSSKLLNCSDSSMHSAGQCYNMTQISSACSSASSSSWSISQSSQATNSSHGSSGCDNQAVNKIQQVKSIDLSKYIDDEEEDEFHDQYEFDLYDDVSSESKNLNHPPSEFTCDSC